MALTINIPEREPMSSRITVDRRLWLNAAKDGLVEDGDPDAAFLWAGPGREVSKDDADRLGYKPKAARKTPAKKKTGRS